ncbi:hypothetical protein ACUNWD_02385 [Sunxiuqinia sp. A32]|uniref:hypothetical protein n=1 Tax=Sunxiuqinia sp. A32 TaxID=3461496 RepID=UPI004045286F
MKNLLLFLLVYLISQVVFSQEEYVFNIDSVTCPKVAVNDCQSLPYMSADVSVMYEQFNRMYTRKIDCGPPAHISSVEIDKPDLYYSIKKLSKYYFKGLKKGIIDKNEAEKELQDILQKCMALHSLKTSPIEQELKAANNPTEILGIFQKIVIE